MKRRLKIVADDKIPFLSGVLDPVATVELLPGRKISRADVMDADALIVRTRTRCGAELLEGSAVKFIATASIGFDHIDTAYCDSQGIVWTNSPGCNSSSVAQYMLSALLSVASREGITLSGKTIGIVGVGNVGSKVAQLAPILGMKVLLNDPPRARTEGPGPFVSLERVLEDSGIITFHVPLIKSGPDRTHHLVNDKLLTSLNRKVLLINTSRGEVAETQALKSALRQGQLRAAVLDVWENEPHLDLELLKACCIATPHIAGYSRDGKANAISMSIRALSRFFGLGLDDWYPERIPPPRKNRIRVEGTGKSLQELLVEVALETYDVMNDDRALREAPGSFEQLRGNYPVRREPGAWKIDLVNDEVGAGPILERLGFQLLNRSETAPG